MKSFVAVLRIAVSLFVLAAVAATFAETASRTTINPFNFFGYFTLQSNILAAVMLIVVGALQFARGEVPSWLHVARGAWVAYMVIVGAVYNTLLVGTPGGGGVALPWANHVLHIVFPMYVLLDWLLFADRTRLRWSRLWVVALYPLVWMTVVLIRGATDGWVPYPFLDPSLGYGVIAVTGVILAGAVVAVGAGVWAISRFRIVRIPGADVAPRTS